MSLCINSHCKLCLVIMLFIRSHVSAFSCFLQVSGSLSIRQAFEHVICCDGKLLDDGNYASEKEIIDTKSYTQIKVNTFWQLLSFWRNATYASKSSTQLILCKQLTSRLCHVYFIRRWANHPTSKRKIYLYIRCIRTLFPENQRWAYRTIFPL